MQEATAKAEVLHLHATNFDIIADSAIIDTSGAAGSFVSSSAYNTTANGSNAYPVCFSATNLSLDKSILFKASGGDEFAGWSGVTTHQPGGREVMAARAVMLVSYSTTDTAGYLGPLAWSVDNARDDPKVLKQLPDLAKKPPITGSSDLKTDHEAIRQHGLD